MYVAAGGVLTPDEPDNGETEQPDKPGDEAPDNPTEEPSLFVTLLEAVVMFFEMIIGFITGLFG